MEETKEQELINPQEPEVIEKEAAAVGKVVVQAIKEEFSGPIPPPDIIEKYERIIPGSADRIMTMAEKQAAHRQAMEKKMIESESRDGLLGIIFAFLLGIGCLIACVVVVCLVPKNAGAISSAFLGVTGIGSITTGFIQSARRTKSKNDDKK
jgi:uncharacterized membrane protein